MPNIDSYLAKIREAVYGEEVRGSIHDALSVMNTNIDSAQQTALRNSIAPTWVKQEYQMGEYVWYPTSDGTLYQAKQYIPATENWTPAHWQAISLATGLYNDVEKLVQVQNTQPTERINQIWIKDRDSEVTVPTFDEFEDLQADLNSLTDNVSIETTYGAYIDNTTSVVNLTPIPYANYAYAVDNCTPGDAYTVYGRGSQVPKLYAFLDEGNHPVKSAVDGEVSNGRKFIAPYNAVKVVFGFYATPYPNYRVYKCSKTTKYSLSLDDAVTISSESNFNDYIRSGNYIVTSNSAASSIANCPSQYRGKLRVDIFGVNLLIQEYLDIATRKYIRCNTNGGWTQWKANASADEIIADYGTGFTPIGIESGYINTGINPLTLNVVVSNLYSHAVVSCIPGQMFVLKGQGAVSGATLWCFADSGKNILSCCTDNVGTNGNYISVVAPENAAYFVFNNRQNVTEGVIYKKDYAPSDVIDFRFFADDFEYGSYDSAGAFSFNNAAISTKAFVPDSITGMTINTSDLKVRVHCWNKNGTSASYYEYIGSTTFAFNHNRYDYKVCIRKNPLDTIFDIPDVLKRITLYANKDKIIDLYEAAYHKQFMLSTQLEGIDDGMRLLMKNNYNVKYANAKVPMPIDTYDGSNQPCHPKVLYFQNGFGGHKFWMCYTPCPFTASILEHPCIAYSEDGYHWTNIPGNPLVTRLDHAYDSDPHLVYRPDTGKLECWWRYIDDYSHDPVREIIYRKTSSNGVDWSSEEMLLYNASGNYDQYLSPSIIWNGSKYQIWVMNTHASPARIDYYESVNATSWTFVRSLNVTFTDDDGITYPNPWHADVIMDNNQYVLCIMCKHSSDSEDRNRWTIFLTTSSDNITYTTPKAIIYGAKGHWDAFLYRPSIVNVDGVYRIYYSGESDAYGQGSGGAHVYYGIGISESNALENFVGKNTY